jgi:hypothetical protein
MFLVLNSDIPSHFNNKSAILSHLWFIEKKKKKVMLLHHAAAYITAKERCPIYTYEKFKMCKHGCFQNYIQRKAASFQTGSSQKIFLQIYVQDI